MLDYTFFESSDLIGHINHLWPVVQDHKSFIGPSSRKDKHFACDDPLPTQRGKPWPVLEEVN